LADGEMMAICESEMDVVTLLILSREN